MNSLTKDLLNRYDMGDLVQHIADVNREYLLPARWPRTDKPPGNSQQELLENPMRLFISQWVIAQADGLIYQVLPHRHWLSVAIAV